MTKKMNVPFIENFDFERFFKGLEFIFVDPIKEIFRGIESNRFPFTQCSFVTVLVLIAHLLELDYFIFKLTNLEILYPTSGYFALAYKISLMISCYYAWGVYQGFLRIKLSRKLTRVFSEAGLKSAVLGRLPSFISDVPLDEDSRKLRLKLRGQSFNDFKNVEDRLGASLQVHIDEVSENRKSGTVDILYSYNELTTSFPYIDAPAVKKDQFVVGAGRSKTIISDLSDVPHLLIAGQTGGGKSTFLRQLITNLYLKNPSYRFELIDLKGGLEFQLFESLPRVNVITDVPSALVALKYHADTTIKNRAELFKFNNCKDIESFLEVHMEDRKYPDNLSSNISLGRKIIVIDEASEIFMSGAYANAADVAKSKSSAAKIGSQGRALGVHLIIATQKPSVKAVDGQIKTHLTGRICFRMSDIASSNTILDSKRAAELPNIKGRAVWRSDSELKEIQAPNMEEKEARELLEKFYTEVKKGYNPSNDGANPHG